MHFHSLDFNSQTKSVDENKKRVEEYISRAVGRSEILVWQAMVNLIDTYSRGSSLAYSYLINSMKMRLFERAKPTLKIIPAS